MSLSGRAWAFDTRHERRIAERAHGASTGGFTGRSKRWLEGEADLMFMGEQPRAK
jgi:hypothetical protein